MQEREKLDIKFKRGHSAESSTLLLSALRPRLNVVGIFVIAASSLLVTQNLLAHNTSAASLTLEVPTTISLDITPSKEGTFAKSTASNFSMKTDAPWGYNLTIKGKSSDAALVNGSSKITSISGNLAEEQFKTTTNNTWGYLPSKVDSSNNSTFRPGPGTTATTLDKTSAKNDTANNYSIILGAKVDDKVIAGAYTNTFTLTSTANTVSYNITYNLNSGTWSGTSPQTGNTTASTITLDSHAPTKSNYTFTGWCTSSNITNNNTTSDPTCTGTKYSASGTYNLSNGTNTVTLYAMWKQNGTSYSIAYNCNSGSPCPSTQSGVTPDANVTLSSTTPSKSDYTFQGWCSTSPSSNNTTSVSCSGYTYQPDGSYPLSRGANVTLYAMWKQNKPNNGDSCSHSGYSGSAKYYANLCWMWSDYKTGVNWSTANSSCPSGWRLPTQTEFQNLIDAVGSGGQLYNVGWGRFSSLYWSSTQYSSGLHYALLVSSSSASVSGGSFDDVTDVSVRCVSS